MDIGEIFLSILEVVSDTITTFVGILPNPDPFPEMIDDIEASISSTDSLVLAYYWLDQFFVADAVITMIGLWFVMFPIAWIIMTLWKWAKVR